MKILIPFLALQCLFFIRCYSQINDCLCADTIITFYSPNNDNTVYTGMYKIINANQPISFVSPFPIITSINPVVPLRDGEGKKGYILEGNINLLFPLWHGRNQTSQFYQNSRFSFKYNPSLRMTLDNSSPIYPTNQKVGLSIEHILWQNYTDKKKDLVNSYDARNWKATNSPLSFLYLTIDAMHYSNGQQGASFDTTLNNSIVRNNYINGDFSTNYVLSSLTYSHLNKHRIYSASLAYQRDGKFLGPFSFDNDQYNRYGQNRLSGFLQYRSAPKPHGRAVRWKDLKCNTPPEFLIKKIHTWRFRYEFEWILDHTNFRKTGGKQYQWGNHVYIEYDPLRSRTASFIAHVYYGRDYFNIRYDNVIFSAMLGVAFSFYKYEPPRLTDSQIRRLAQ